MSLPATFPALVESARPGVCVDAACAFVAVGEVPTGTVVPTITGTAEVGETLTLSFGTWLDADTVVGRVERSPDGVNNWQAVTSYGAGTSYTVQPSDRLMLLRVRVRATNAAGDGYANSAATDMVPLVDADAIAYIAAVEAEDGQSLERGVAIAFEDFVLGLKADSLWDKLSACCIMAGARTFDGALVPLRGPAPDSYNFDGSEYLRKTGLRSNGANKYLDTKVLNTAFARDNQHMAVWRTESETRTAVRAAMGVGANQTGRSQLVTSATARIFRIQYGTSGTESLDETTAIAGLWGASRSAENLTHARYNQTTTNLNRTSSDPSGGEIHVYGRNGGSGISDARMSWYSIGTALELAALEGHIGDLMNALDGAIA